MAIRQAVLKKIVIEHFVEFCDFLGVDFDEFEAEFHDLFEGEKCIVEYLECKKRHAITDAFTWLDSKSGHEYWRNVNIAWQLYCKNRGIE